MTAKQARNLVFRLKETKENLITLKAQKEKDKEITDALLHRNETLTDTIKQIKKQIKNGWGYCLVGSQNTRGELLKEDLEKLGYIVYLNEFKGSDDSDVEMMYFAKWL